MRKAIYHTINKAYEKDSKYSKMYDWFIMITAFISVTPLMVRGSYPILDKLDVITVYILFMDYIFRWMTYDYHSKKKAPWAFVLYPVTPFAIFDLLSLLPSLGLLGPSFMILRMLRIFKVLHYSKSFIYIANVFKAEKKTLTSVLLIALAYIYISALLMFSYEPDTFDNFFGALYWATTALTTVGYGDVYPVTQIGRLISMISSLFGIAVIAMPAGIVTAGFVDEINKDKKQSMMEDEEEKTDE